MTLTLKSSNPALASECADIRSLSFDSFISFIAEHKLRLHQHSLEQTKIEFEIEKISEKLSENVLSITAETGYETSFSDLSDDYSERSKTSSAALALSIPITANERLKRDVLNASLKKNLVFFELQKIRFLSATLAEILEIGRLNALLKNAETKLPLIEKKLEFYYLMEELGTANIQKIAEAEISKLNTQNEITNFLARKKIIISKFTSDTKEVEQIFKLLPEMTYFDLENLTEPCEFFDKEIEIKKIEANISEVEFIIQKRQIYPLGELKFSYQSNDRHSGPFDNSLSVGFSFKMPLYDGGRATNNINDSRRNKALKKRELALQKTIFNNKENNFNNLEKSYLRSFQQAKVQLQRNEEKIKELEERKNSGYSVFIDITERQLQNIELQAILIDLEYRILSFWSEYLENLT